MWLVDANVLSEPTRASPSPSVVEWLRTHERTLCIDPIILGELRFGVLATPAGRRRMQLTRWFDDVARTATCLPWDAKSGVRWAELLADLRKRGRSMPVRDSMIAATALVHDLTVVTRNERDFAHARVDVLNPFGG